MSQDLAPSGALLLAFPFISFLLRQASASGSPLTPCFQSADLETSAERKRLFPANSSRRPGAAFHSAGFGPTFFPQPVAVARWTHRLAGSAHVFKCRAWGWRRSLRNPELRGRGWFLKGRRGGSPHREEHAGQVKNHPRGCAEGSSRALPGRCLREERNTAGGRKAPGGGDRKPLL